MNITDIVKNSINYAFSDWKKLLILGVLFVISDLSTILAGWNIGGSSGALISILSIVGLLLFILISGYELSIIRESSEGSNVIPNLDLKDNFILGIKNIILEVIYGVICLILFIIFAIITGSMGVFAKLIETLSANPNVNAIPNVLINQAAASFSVLFVLIFIVILFALFFILIAECRLAKTGSLSEGLKINKVIGDMVSIGVGSYIVWFVLVAICAMIIGIVGLVFAMIPYIGALLSSLIVTAFFTLFYNRALGLLYSKIE